MLVLVRTTVELIDEGLGRTIDRKDYGQQMRITTYEPLEEIFEEYNRRQEGEIWRSPGAQLLSRVMRDLGDSMYRCLATGWTAPTVGREEQITWEV
jgi:hypothetical protein